MESKGGKTFLWEYPFFGLTDNYKIQLHEILFDLCHFGKLEYDAVYSMPVQYRTFYIRKLSNVKEKEKAAYDSMGKQQASPSQGLARGPAINR